MSEKQNSDRDDKGRFKPGNSQRYGIGKEKDKTRGKGNEAGRPVTRLTSYLKKFLAAKLADTKTLKKLMSKYGSEKTVMQVLVERFVESCIANPPKTQHLIKQMFDRVDGVLTPEIEVDPDTPVTVVKFVVVGARPKAVEESEDEL